MLKPASSNFRTAFSRFGVAAVAMLLGWSLLFGSSAPVARAEPGDLTIDAYITAPAAGAKPHLVVKAAIPDSYYIYSLSQVKPPVATRIRLKDPDGLSETPTFRTLTPPHVTPPAEFDVPTEKHEVEAVWVAPLDLAPGVNLANLELAGSVNAQRCTATSCLNPKSFAFTARLSDRPLPQPPTPISPSPAEVAEVAKSPAAPTRLQAESSGSFDHPLTHATLHGAISPSVVAPGSTLRLQLTAVPEAPYHIYELAAAPRPDAGSKPTLIHLSYLPAGWQVGSPEADRPPHRPEPSEADAKKATNAGPKVGEYSEPVVWTVNIAVPEDAEPGEYLLQGIIGYQTCNEGSCDHPRAARFEGVVRVDQQNNDAAAPLAFAGAKYGEVELAMKAASQETSDDDQPGAVAATGSPPPPTNYANYGDFAATGKLPWEAFTPEYFSRLNRFERLDAPPPESSGLGVTGLAYFIGIAFVAGFLLNFMPCVLPVIGLKVMSFVNQSGSSRSRVLALNLWYTAGLLSVFVGLATLAAAFSVAWGGLFANMWFTVTLAAVVFAFALSFLGVWEVPIPGFVGGHAANELASKEGPSGAFAKGVLTTVLATPCTGPLLAPALGWAVAQPPVLTYAVFVAVGLGMASPYLLIGAFPRLIAFLPKPGPWMDTFKQLMGFTLLGTVVWLMFSLPYAMVTPMVALLVGVWFACWWIGRVPVWAELPVRIRGWAIAAGLVMLAAWFSMDVLRSGFQRDFESKYVVAKIPERQAGDYTVMVDFTADWCLTCQTNKAVAYNTQATAELIRDLNIVPMKADITDGSDPTVQAIEQFMKERLQHGSGAIPLLAIFPADPQQPPIILDGLLSQGTVLSALREAGQSRSRDPGALAMRSSVGR